LVLHRSKGKSSHPRWAEDLEHLEVVPRKNEKEESKGGESIGGGKLEATFRQKVKG